MSDKAAKIAELKARMAKRKQVVASVKQQENKAPKISNAPSTDVQEFLKETPTVVPLKRKQRGLVFDAEAISTKEEKLKNERFKRELIAKGILKVGEVTDVIEVANDTSNVEWWDRQYIDNAEYPVLDETTITAILNGENCGVRADLITNLVEHPEVVETKDTGEFRIKSILSKDEMKRVRKINREEKFQKMRDEVLVGIREPPKLKLKLSNMAKVFPEEIVVNPTEVERLVREEMAIRKAEHERRNNERKLTKSERKAKMREKFKEDQRKGLVMVVFKLRFVGNKHKGRLIKNARQLLITGILLNSPDNILLIAEGGMKAMNKFKEDGDDIKNENDVYNPNEVKLEQELIVEKEEQLKVFDDVNSVDCKLLWEGKIDQLQFSSFVIEEHQDTQSIVKILKMKQLSHLWKFGC
ncbi:U4/U6 small nuclear ribonucleoprotein Prp3 [Entamoeba marina]